MVFKSLVFFFAWLGSYLILILGNYTFEINLIFWIILGFFIAFMCINIGHDAIHGAYSSKKWINQVLAHTFNINGASVYMWRKVHNHAHHTYTNIEGLDKDIGEVPFSRLSPNQKHKTFYKYQHIYILPLYGFASLSWIFVKDYVNFFKNEVGNYNGRKHSYRAYFWLFFYKILNYTLFLGIPVLVMQDAWWLVITGFLVMHFFTGMTLALIFMLAHVVEQTNFPQPGDNGSLQNSWAVHQLHTTANFSRKNNWSLFFTGGLNLQVEHHLFPHICSIHYQAIAPIVEETANDFNLPYLYNKSFASALTSHIRFLKKMGQPEDYTT